MTLLAPNTANALAAHVGLEPFVDVAFRELAAHPLVESGVCMNPMCSKHFTQSRTWQRYCSVACRKMDDLDMRRIGHKAAPALLAWRMGKHDKTWTVDGLVETTPELRALSRVGRRYVSQLQSEWWKDRLRRAAESGGI